MPKVSHYNTVYFLRYILPRLRNICLQTIEYVKKNSGEFLRSKMQNFQGIAFIWT